MIHQTILFSDVIYCVSRCQGSGTAAVLASVVLSLLCFTNSKRTLLVEEQSCLVIANFSRAGLRSQPPPCAANSGSAAFGLAAIVVQMARDDTGAEGPPAKRARPTSVEDVVIEKAGQQQGAAAAKAGRGMLTLEEVTTLKNCC